MDIQDLFDKCEDDYYITKLPYPNDRGIRDALNKIATVMESTSKLGVTIEPLMVYASELLREYGEMKEAKKAYNTDERRLNNEFRQDLIDYFETKDHPYEQEIYRMADEEGHSSGYTSVVNWYSTLVDAFPWPPETVNDIAFKQLCNKLNKRKVK